MIGATPKISDRLHKAQRVVIKIGSALLVDADSGKLKATWLASLAADIAALRQRGSEVVIVSSGAIALGRRLLKLPNSKLKLQQSQAAAAVGQIALAQAWQQALADDNLIAAQVLLTLSDTEQRRRYLNARATLFTLLRQGAIPVINENDTVATSEIRYGDNDRLAARVTSMISADCLVLLSDVDGLYSAPPDQAEAKHIAEINDITPQIMAMAGKPVSELGSGGMITKLEAARIATGAGANMVIASGYHLHPLKRIEEGALASWFAASSTPVAARKLWIAGTLEPVGQLKIDAGAVRALTAGKSLLPAGITEISGDFNRGDAVRIVDSSGCEIARGLITYDKLDAQRIMGCQSGEIETRLGVQGRDEMVHRDDLVLLGSGQG